MDDFLSAHNPFVSQAIGAVPLTATDQLPELYLEAKAAQAEWTATSFKQRREVFMNLRDQIIHNMRHLVETISSSTSKPYVESLSADVWGTLESLRWCVDQAPKKLKSKPLWMGRYWFILRQSVVTPKPLGVVGIISPWNFPMAIPMGQILPSLMSGNAVIIKPSELTPLVGMAMKELFEASSFPKGLVQFVFGGREVGEALVTSGVNKVLFTGSTQVGHKVAAQAAAHGIPVSLELGGKDAMVVCADASLETAARGALWGGFANCGQVCASVERLFVHASIHDRFVHLLKEKMKKMRLGPPENFNDMGTVISDTQKQKVQRALDKAKELGLDVFRPFPQSDLVQPTVVLGATSEMDIAQNEIFGPVLPVIPFQSEEELIENINSSRYGLSASVWSESTSHAKRIAERLEVGTVTINGSAYTHALPMTPWGGIKDSGWGRTHGQWGLEEVTTPHHIHYNFNKGKVTEFWWFGYTQNLYEILLDLAVQFTRPGRWGWLLGLFPFLAIKRQRKY